MADKSKLKKIVYGVLLIIAAVVGYLVAALDGDPETKTDIKEAIEGVKEGVEVIKEAKDPEDAEQPEAPEVEEKESGQIDNERKANEMAYSTSKSRFGCHYSGTPIKTH